MVRTGRDNGPGAAVRRDPSDPIDPAGHAAPRPADHATGIEPEDGSIPARPASAEDRAEPVRRTAGTSRWVWPVRPSGRRILVVATGLVGLLGLVGLGASGILGHRRADPPADAAAAPAEDVVVAVATAPGTDRSFRGARGDVVDESCSRSGSTWSATGTVANSSDAPRDYRIYVAFVDPTGDTGAVVERNVTDLGAGESRTWRAVATLADAPAIRCVLRVEQDRPTA